VADRLTGPWLEARLGPEAPEVRAWAEDEARGRAAVARLHRAWVELDALYRSAAPEGEKRAEKAARLAALQAELGWPRPPNNATLAGYRTYDAGGPAFERLLAACQGSLPRLLAAVATLRPRDFGTPQREDFDDVLDRLAAAGCAPGPG
jgi:predicted aminopeptidase